MYHPIEFTATFKADLEYTAKQPLERLRINKGTRTRAVLRPYVAEKKDGLIEVADLFFEDGTTTRRVPYAYFKFIESRQRT